MAQYIVRPRWNIAGKGIAVLLLAALLAACAPGSPRGISTLGPAANCSPGLPGGTSSFPKDKLSVLRVPASYALPGQIVRGPDGNLWFPAIAYGHFATNQPSGAIGNLTSSGQFHFFPLPDLNSYPTSITFGGDGSIWLVAFQGNGKLAPLGDTPRSFTGGFSEIGHMTPQGQFHLFPLPSPNISVESIAVGPHGNLWFTEDVDEAGATLPRIGRMTPAGAFSSFPITSPFADSYLHQIIAGPDGNLWFSLEGADASYNALGAIGRITPQGAISIASLGKFAVPADMTIGPDQNLWFTTGFEVGRVTPRGQACLFDPDSKANPADHIAMGGITTGPDGALWFATADAKVGRVSTSGAFRFYPLPNGAGFDNGSSSLDLGQLKGIAMGADGTLWLTNDGQIGHFV
jgi:virginiamycin B lyase